MAMQQLNESDALLHLLGAACSSATVLRFAFSSSK